MSEIVFFLIYENTFYNGHNLEGVVKMIHTIQDTTTLHNGVKMPWLGFGVFKVDEGTEVIQSVKWALEAGYKSIDTAAIYKNEEGSNGKIV